MKKTSQEHVLDYGEQVYDQELVQAVLVGEVIYQNSVVLNQFSEKVVAFVSLQDVAVQNLLES